MKILLNFSSVRKGGGIQVALSLVEQLHQYPQITWAIIGNTILEKELARFNLSNVINYTIEEHPLKIYQRRRFVHKMNGFEKQFLPDIVFSLFGPSYWKPQATHLEGFAIPHFVFPDSPYFQIIGFKQKLFHKVSKWVKSFFLKYEADYWVVENEAIISNLAQLLNVSKERIFTVPNTCHQVFDHPENWSPVHMPLKRKGSIRLVCISAYYPHKNLQLIAQILDQQVLDPELNVEFVTTLPDVIYRMLNPNKHSNWINLGPIKIEQCPFLYQNADALFLPTLLESFSASYLEAMKMGTPIVTTDLSFAHYICEDAALYFKPLSAEDAIRKIVEIKNPIRKAELISAGAERLKKFGSANERLEKYISLFYQLKSK